MKTYQIVSLSLLTTLLLTACGGTSPSDETPIEQSSYQEEEPSFKSTDIKRNMNPAYLEEDIKTLISASTDFTFDTYHYLENKKSNHFTSTYFIFNFLSMLSAGADGETKNQILNAINVELPQDILHESMNGLNLQFPRSSGGFKFTLANTLWLQEGVQLEEDFINTLGTNYGMNTQYVNFQDNPDLAGTTINNWVKEKTNNAITDLVTKDTLNKNTKVLFSSALYLKAQWERSFALNETQESDFTLESGELIQAPMMHQKGEFRYKEIDGTQLLCMHYKDTEYRLLSILPKEGTFSEFEKNFNAQTFYDLLRDPVSDTINLKDKQIDLYYPKYQFENTINYAEILKEKGMVDAFNQNADFTPMSKDISLNISQIIQKTFFKVDEEGTEAATSATMSLGATSEIDLQLKFDRPFIFVLCHEPTKTILFLGRMMNPLDKR